MNDCAFVLYQILRLYFLINYLWSFMNPQHFFIWKEVPDGRQWSNFMSLSWYGLRKRLNFYYMHGSDYQKRWGRWVSWFPCYCMIGLGTTKLPYSQEALGSYNMVPLKAVLIEHWVEGRNEWDKCFEALFYVCLLF